MRVEATIHADRPRSARRRNDNARGTFAFALSLLSKGGTRRKREQRDGRTQGLEEQSNLEANQKGRQKVIARIRGFCFRAPN